MWEKRNPCEPLLGMYISAATMENSVQVPQKTKNRAINTIQQFHSWVYTQKKNENINSKRYMYPNIHSSTIYNSQDMEAT